MLVSFIGCIFKPIYGNATSCRIGPIIKGINSRLTANSKLQTIYENATSCRIGPIIKGINSRLTANCKVKEQVGRVLLQFCSIPHSTFNMKCFGEL